MLLLFAGPTGVGRTTVIRSGMARHGWRLAPTYTSRPARTGSHDTKTWVPEIADEEGVRVTTYCGGGYSTREDELGRAAAQPLPITACDWPHAYPEPLPPGWPAALGVILLVDDAALLEERLRRAGRPERVARAGPELARARSVLLPSRWLRVDASGDPTATTDRIDAIARSVAARADPG